MKFGHFFNFLSQTRIILTPEPECSSLTHTCTTHPCLSTPADLVVTVLLQTLQPFPKTRWPFVSGRHIPLGSVRNVSARWTPLYMKVRGARSLPHLHQLPCLRASGASPAGKRPWLCSGWGLPAAAGHSCGAALRSEAARGLGSSPALPVHSWSRFIP